MVFSKYMSTKLCQATVSSEHYVIKCRMLHFSHYVNYGMQGARIYATLWNMPEQCSI